MIVMKAFTILLFFFISEIVFADTNNTIKKPLKTIKISYPIDPISDHTGWQDYFGEVLELSLSKLKIPYVLEAVSLATRSQSRAERLIDKGIVTLDWIHTSVQKEQSLLPIRIPLFKGLIGWRLFLVHQSKINLFQDVTTLESLKTLSVLQGIDWPDTAILKENGFNVRTSRNTENLLRMLQHGRGDYFPRGVTEIWGELNSVPNKAFVVEKKLVLQYPTAFYFFVSKNNLETKILLEKGMNIAISDGSFDKLFMKYFSGVIERSNLHNRKVLNINNPFLPAKTPLSRKELWFATSNTY